MSFINQQQICWKRDHEPISIPNSFKENKIFRTKPSQEGRKKVDWLASQLLKNLYVQECKTDFSCEKDFEMHDFDNAAIL